MAEQTLNIPQLIAVVLVGFLAIRWFMSSGSQSNGSRAGRQANPAHVEQIHQMFPQLDRRSIAWDLQQNGGSVQATTERVLGGRQLAQPPPSFQPQLPASASPQTSSTSRQQVTKAPLPDLISRYNLSSKITPGADEPGMSEGQTGSEASKKTGWSQNKTERSELFKRRREEMVLAARRKMEAKERQAASS
ncbi:CUE domain-containing protein 1 [Elsinoe australis]|uniref:Coupling of ubiquitin conjugation to ER degradation protein 1 n=1 Tax=Elsinoe australis TaxID=40998 RepID=A0A4U7BBX0_9PEZI|nr:CUE domain-containing protein 1 [Elsinoe australis]